LLTQTYIYSLFPNYLCSVYVISRSHAHCGSNLT